MKYLVVYAHPVPTSFSSALYQATVSTLRQKGHEVRALDLYAMNFDPRLSRAERERYLDLQTGETSKPPISGELEPHVDALRWAEGLVLVFPTWWFGVPAILKGWLDRVWMPGVVFDYETRQRNGQAVVIGLNGKLTNVTRLVCITTTGSPWWALLLLRGNPARRQVYASVGPNLSPKLTKTWLSLDRMDSASPEKRKAFLQLVEQRLSKL
ncbi:MAG: NAD(P)H-dependent oxidoreductase [Geminicoccaceae bacterium]